MLNNIMKRKNPRTGTVHIVREQYRYRLVGGYYGYRNIMYCDIQDNLHKDGKDGWFPMVNGKPTCKTCIKSFVSTMRKDMGALNKSALSKEAEKFNDVRTRYVLATYGGGDQRYHPIVDETDVFNNALEFENLQDAIDERDEMDNPEGIVIVKEIREVLNI